MGTKVHCESYFPAYFSMRDLNEDSNTCSWPLYYGDKPFTNGQYCNGFSPRAIADVYSGNDKDAVKRKMLEHEAIFKNQLYELHRLYQIQRDLMEEIKRKELHKTQILVETSLSSNALASQVTSEDARKWQIPSFPLANSVCARLSSSIAEDIHSPLSSLKGSSAQVSPLPSQNGDTSKDVEILESRPTKVRKKMFDLQLPADQYIDTEEGKQCRDENVCGISTYLSNRNHKMSPESGVNLFLSNCGKNNCQRDASRSESRVRCPNNVGDLNKPIEIEDTNASAYIDLLGRTSSNGKSPGLELAAKPKSQSLGFPKEILLNSHRESANGMLNNPHLQTNMNGKRWFPHLLDTEHCNNNLKSVSQGFETEKLPTFSQPIQVLFNKAHESPTLFPIDQGKSDQSRDRTIYGLEPSEKNHEISHNTCPEPVVASHTPISYPIAPSDLGKSWSSVSSWDKPHNSFSEKSISVQRHPYLNPSASLSRSSQSSTHSHGLFGDQWNFASKPTFKSEIPNSNGFYYGSSSGSKELLCLPSGRYDYWNCSSSNNVASDHFTNHSLTKFYKSSDCVDSKPAKDVNLNVVLSNSSSNKVVSQQGLEVIDFETKHEDHLAALPWLKAKPACKNENSGLDLNTGEMSFLRPSLNKLSNKNETGKGPNQMVIQDMKSASCSNVVDANRIEIGDSSSCRKLLGFPIFEKPHISKQESSSFTALSTSRPQPSEREVENDSKTRLLDINLPCDPTIPDFCEQTATAVLNERQMDAKVANLRHQIDLNSCMSEDEVSLMPPVPGANVKTVVGIDLEASAVSETEDDIIPREEKVHESPLTQDKAESSQDELVRGAAEAIVALSSCSAHIHLYDASSCLPEASMTGPLHWFVEIVSTYGEDLEKKLVAASRSRYSEDNQESSLEEIDYFESMILNLPETKEEDYIPKPLVPENLKLEETGPSLLPTRTRKGQARRGRQRRDFQRDILPGLASLSRHEVTEDLQTFGGLMRATGYLWQSGLTRRNSTRSGCARGRRRSVVSSTAAVIASTPCTPLVQQLNNIEVGLEDRSLTGWGKTTRRPRRQRCPAGNLPSLPVT